MSTGADCRFIEEEPGVWFYEIQKYPYGETDEYNLHGPFDSEETAEEHLYSNYANPGGWMIERYGDDLEGR